MRHRAQSLRERAILRELAEASHEPSCATEAPLGRRRLPKRLGDRRAIGHGATRLRACARCETLIDRPRRSYSSDGAPRCS